MTAMPLDRTRTPGPAPTWSRSRTGRTARRLDWMLLPPMTRAAGRGPVRHHGGRRGVRRGRLHPGLASVLTGADGRQIFLKAASKKAQRPFARRLPRGDPQAAQPALGAARARGCCGATRTTCGWCSALEHVDGHNPVRPWRRDELDACLDTLELVAQTLTPAARCSCAPSPRSSRTSSTGWDHVRADVPGLAAPRRGGRAGRPRYATATAGNTLVHTDARDDNLIVTDRPGLPLRLELAGRRRGLDRHRLPADDRARRRHRRRRGARRAPAHPQRRPPTTIDSRAGPVLRLLPRAGATSRRRTRRRTCACTRTGAPR